MVFRPESCEGNDKQFTIFLGVVVILLLNVSEVLIVGGGAHTVYGLPRNVYVVPVILMCI